MKKYEYQVIHDQQDLGDESAITIFDIIEENQEDGWEFISHSCARGEYNEHHFVFRKQIPDQRCNISELIEKYEGILQTLKENKSIEESGDFYPYNLDIRNTMKFLQDLKQIKL